MRGRYFTDADDDSKPTEVIINQTLAERFFSWRRPDREDDRDLDLTPKG